MMTALRVFMIGLFGVTLCAGCADDETSLVPGDIGPDVPTIDQGLTPAVIDAGVSCADCLPARNGLFCGFTVGCGVNQPQASCHFDGSGDAVVPPMQCGCDGELFVPTRFGGQNGQAAADRPFGLPSGCTLPEG